MTTTSATFDLTTETWIPVVDLRGEQQEVSLGEAFSRAHKLRRIVGETPPMTAALYRLLLAVLHRAYGPADRRAWATLWKADHFPAGPLSTYFSDCAERFDLFHPVTPFLQCPGLSLVPGRSSVAKLVPHKSVGNNVTLFDHTTAGDQLNLSPAAAARWLVTTHAFDPGGMKTPYKKDKSSERAPCATIGVTVVEGATLKDTLLLNALAYEPEAERPTGMTTPADAPAWEVEPPSPEPVTRPARGWTDLLTWPSRRILLFPHHIGHDVHVSQVVLAPGTRLKDDLHEVELQAAFRKPPDPKGTPQRDAPMLPVRLHPVRGIWRFSVELLLVDVYAEERTRQRPYTLKQIADLVEHGIIPADTIYTLRVFGQQLDSKASVVEAYLEDEVPAPVALIRATDGELAGLIGCAIEFADETGAALRAMQRAYLKDLRAQPTGDIDVGYWPHLARPFAEFLRAVSTARLAGLSESPAVDNWARHVKKVAVRASERWAAGNSAQLRNLSMIGKHQGEFLRRLGSQQRLLHSKITAYLTKDEDT